MVWRADVAAPEGNGSEAAEIGTALWSEAIVPAKEADMAFWPRVAGSLADMADRVVSVAAPVGRGREAALTGRVLWSDAITTGLEADMAFWPTVGVLPSIDAKEVLPVV